MQPLFDITPCVLKSVMQFQIFSLDYNLKKNSEIEFEVVLDLQLWNVQCDPPPMFASLQQTFFVFLSL
jgi:hypothetical protein